MIIQDENSKKRGIISKYNALEINLYEIVSYVVRLC